MRPYLFLFALLILFTFSGFAVKPLQNTYSIIGSWKLIGMQLDGQEGGEAMEQALDDNHMRFVFEESGQFTMVLGPNGRGLSGGYLYDEENQILSIMYGSHTDTALVSWESADKMIHATKDGKTRTTMQRVTE